MKNQLVCFAFNLLILSNSFNSPSLLDTRKNQTKPQENHEMETMNYLKIRQKTHTHTHTNKQTNKQTTTTKNTLQAVPKRPIEQTWRRGKEKPNLTIKKLELSQELRTPNPHTATTIHLPCSLLLTDGLLGRVHAQRLQQSADGFINKTQIRSCRNTHELEKETGGGRGWQ